MTPRSEAIRHRLLQMHVDSGSGHFGGNLSSLEIISVLHHDVMTDEDTFVLSKGHAAGALYAVLWSKGILSDDDLRTWCADGTSLPGHPVASVPGVQFSTGSLGHGTSLALGIALGTRWRQESGHVFCLTSDGEWQEGSSWEALMLATHMRPDNLTVIVDVNGLQGFGYTQETLSMADLSGRFSSFGAHVVEVDGHDEAALIAALRDSRSGGFTVLCARTIKGRGTSLAGMLESHYLPLPQQDRPQPVLDGAR